MMMMMMMNDDAWSEGPGVTWAVLFLALFLSVCLSLFFVGLQCALHYILLLLLLSTTTKF